MRTGRPAVGFSYRELTRSFDGERSAVAADWDGDGDLDVVSTTEVGDEVRWWENRRLPFAADFGTPEWIEQATVDSSALDLADLDRDGAPELVGMDRNSDSATDVFYWDWTGSTWTRVTIDGAFIGTTSVRVVHLNNDDFPDLLATISGVDSIRWYEGTGDGTYTPHVASDMVAGAEDADGLPDVLGSSTDLSSVGLYPNLGGQYRVMNLDVSRTTIDDGANTAAVQFAPVYIGSSDDVDMRVASVTMRLEDTSGTPLTEAQADALFATISVALDADLDGEFDPLVDPILAATGSFPLTLGRLELAIDELTAAIGYLDSPKFLVVIETEGDASAQSPNSFRITHLPGLKSLCNHLDPPSMALHAPSWQALATGAMHCVAAGTIFIDDFESGSFDAWSVP